MLLWVLIALLTAAAVMAVLVPLGRSPADTGGGLARGVYLEQLDDLARDLAQGRIGAAEAGAARAEIARRLIAADGADALPLAGASPLARRAVAVVALAGIPALALGLYLTLGAPGVPGQPLAARLAAPPSAADVDVLVARVEQHLEASPDDGRGWDVIAPIYMRLGRAEDAALAYRNAIRLLGSSEGRQSGLGEALSSSGGGIVTADARAAFESAQALDPKAPAPRYFLGLAAEQDGRLDAAGATWRSLLADSAADAPWRKPLEDGLARLDRPRGPTQAQIAAAGSMAPQDRTAMIEGMVANLAERLQGNPDDVDGWIKLIRSYAVLGRTDEAAGAVAAALRGVTGVDDRKRVETLVTDLGLKSARSLTP